MSILNKLKNLNTRKTARLLEVHPLAGESLELRLQYLAGVALATAIDREPSDAERMTFNALADSLQVDAVDAQEQLDERASVTEEDIALLFAAIRERDAGYLYLLDLAWIHAADGELEESEMAVTEELAGLLDIPPSVSEILHELSFSIRSKDKKRLIKTTPAVFENKKLYETASQIINREISMSGVIDGGWIDHGDDTATEIETGITWMRFKLGEECSHNKASTPKASAAKTFPQWMVEGRNNNITEEIKSFQNENPRFKKWRLPKASENPLKPATRDWLSGSGLLEMNKNVFPSFTEQIHQIVLENPDGTRETSNPGYKGDACILLCRHIDQEERE